MILAPERKQSPLCMKNMRFEQTFPHHHHIMRRGVILPILKCANKTRKLVHQTDSGGSGLPEPENLTGL